MDLGTISSIGAPLVGGLMSAFGKSKPAQTTQIPKFNPQQNEALNQLLSQAMSGLGGNAMENEARRGFAQKTVPTIAERFAGMDGLSSSGYRNSLAEAGSDLESSIAGMKQGNLMNLLQLGLTPQNESIYREEQPGRMQQMGSSLLSGLPSSLNLLSQQSQGSSMMELLKSMLSGNQGQQADVGVQGQVPQQQGQFGLSSQAPIMNLLNMLSNPNTFMRG